MLMQVGLFCREIGIGLAKKRTALTELYLKSKSIIKKYCYF